MVTQELQSEERPAMCSKEPRELLEQLYHTLPIQYPKISKSRESISEALEVRARTREGIMGRKIAAHYAGSQKQQKVLGCRLGF